MTGLLILDKPEGMSSFGAIRKVRWLTGEKKAGHAGTLDPMATGVLPVLLGGATRFLDFLPESGKRYTATFRLGMRTDTLDGTGEVLETSDVSATRTDVEQALPAFRGDILQVPPMYSALKKDGVRLYDLARKGQEVEREPRPVTISTLELFPEGENPLGDTPLSKDEYAIDVACSSGTYIRSLIDDLGSALGCGAVMTGLRRTEACGFSLSDAHTPDSLETLRESGEWDHVLLPLDRVLRFYPEVTVSEKQAVRFRNGGALMLGRIPAFRNRDLSAVVPSLYRVYDPAHAFLGLGEPDGPAGELKVKRLYVSR